MQAAGRRHARNFDGRRQGSGKRKQGAQKQKRQRGGWINLQPGLQAPEISGAEVHADGGEQLLCEQEAAANADHCARATDQDALGKQHAQYGTPRCTQGAQQRNLAAPVQHCQGLGGVDQEGTGEQGDQRQHVEIRPVCTGQGGAAQVFRLRSQQLDALGQQV